MSFYCFQSAQSTFINWCKMSCEVTCSTYLAQRNGKVLPWYFCASWKLESTLSLIKQYGVSHEMQIILRAGHRFWCWRWFWILQMREICWKHQTNLVTDLCHLLVFLVIHNSILRAFIARFWTFLQVLLGFFWANETCLRWVLFLPLKVSCFLCWKCL